MNKKVMIAVAGISSFIVLMMAGCNRADPDENARNNNVETQPIHYETNEEQKGREGTRELSIGEKGGYKQSDQKGTNATEGNNGTYTDIFTNKEAEKIYRHVTGLNDIKNAQIASTEDKVIVAVMLNEHSNHDVRDIIEQEVRKIVPNKNIVVYTDDIYWDRMSNLKSRLKPAEGGEGVEEEFKEFFNLDN